MNCKAEFKEDLPSCPHDGGHLIPEEQARLLGTTFADRYEIMSILGEGGMSVVYKARHNFMNKIVAVKVLHSHLVDNSTVRRFQQEAEAASSLTHQNIIGVHDFGITKEGQAFLVMDCLEGPSLADVLDEKGHISPAEVCDIFKQVCDGLEVAHRKGVIHRDLKPSNLVLTLQEDKTMLVKIVDFGIAKMINTDGKNRQQLTTTGQVFGSPLYMSPEQCIGAVLDPRADIYSLGCVMYEALSGKLPFMGQTAVATMHKHVSELPKHFENAVPGLEVPEALENTVLKCLSKDPNHRYQSVSELRQDLIAAGNGKPHISADGTPAPSAPPPPRPHVAAPPPAAKRPMGAGAKIGMVLSALLFCAWAWYFFLWDGPEGDGGKTYKKTMWVIETGMAQQAADHKNYAWARQLLKSAEQLASDFKDNNARLLNTLSWEADVFGNCAMFDEQEKVNKRIRDIHKDQYLGEFKKAMADLKDLASAPTSDVGQSMKRFKAEANADRITLVAKKLYTAGLYKQEETLLRTAMTVYTTVIGDDYLKMADFSTGLADCYIAQQRTPEVRPLLVKALGVLRKTKKDDDQDTIRGILKLGQFDKDQSDFDPAGKELEKALELARSSHTSNQQLIMECLNSYGDYFKQTGKKEEAEKFFKLARDLAEQPDTN